MDGNSNPNHDMTGYCDLSVCLDWFLNTNVWHETMEIYVACADYGTLDCTNLGSPWEQIYSEMDVLNYASGTCANACYPLGASYDNCSSLVVAVRYFGYDGKLSGHRQPVDHGYECSVPTNTPTNTPVPPTNTPTNTPVPATNTPTNTPGSATPTPGCGSGYTQVELLSEQFESWPLSGGWTIINNSGDCVWRAGSNESGTADSNATGGSGDYADADSDDCGSGTNVDTELRLPVLDFGDIENPWLEFKSDMRYYSSGGDEFWSVDVSTNGGSTWTNELYRDGADFRGPETIVVSLNAYAGAGSVLIRMHYGSASWDYWWQVDDVYVYGCSSGSLPTNTPTNTPVPPTNTPTNTPVPPTNTPTNTPVHQSNTPVSSNDLIWVVNASGRNGNSIFVDVMIDNQDTNVDAFTFHMGYDTSMLSYLSCTEGDLNPGWNMFSCNEASSGDITISGFTGATGILSGSYGSFVRLTFDVVCGACTNGDTGDLILSGLLDDCQGSMQRDGLFTYDCTITPTPTPQATPNCIHDGDVTLDGNISAGDAQLAFNIALEVLFPIIRRRMCSGLQQ